MRNGKRSGRRRGKKSTRSAYSKPGSLRAELGGGVVRMQLEGVPFAVVQENTGGGGALGFVSADSNLSATAPINIAYLDPFSVGGRTTVMATMFQKYRVLGGELEYRPNLLSGTSTINLVNPPACCFGWHPDLVQAPNDYADGIRFGGKPLTLTKMERAPIGKSPWLYTSTVTSNPSLVDLRMCCFGGFYFWADGNAPGSISVELGVIVITLDIEFMGAQDGPSLGRESRYLTQYKDQLRQRLVAESKSAEDVSSPSTPAEFEFVPPGPLAIARLAADVAGASDDAKESSVKETKSSSSTTMRHQRKLPVHQLASRGVFGKGSVWKLANKDLNDLAKDSQ